MAFWAGTWGGRDTVGSTAGNILFYFGAGGLVCLFTGLNGTKDSAIPLQTSAIDGFSSTAALIQ